MILASYIIAIIVGCGGYWLTTDHVSRPEIIHLCLVTIITTFIVVSIPSFTYWHRHKLETIINFVDEEWKHKGLSRKLESCIKAREKVVLYLILSACLCGWINLLLYPFEKLVHNPSKGKHILDYVFPVPWLHRIKSTSLYLLVFIIQAVCSLIISSALVCWNPFFVSLAYQIYNAFSITCDRMLQFSTQAEATFEKTYEKFSHCNDTLVFGNKGLQIAAEKKIIALQCEIEYHQRRLLQNVSIIAKEHQQLRRYEMEYVFIICRYWLTFIDVTRSDEPCIKSQNKKFLFLC